MIKNKLALSGKANSGKGTVSKIFEDKLSNCFTKTQTFAFADPMKNIVKIMFPSISSEWLWGDSQLRSCKIPNAKDSNGSDLTCRQCLLDLGKLGRSYQSNIWIDATLKLVNSFLSDHEYKGLTFLSDRGDPGFFDRKIACINDVRFSNEFDALRKDGFFICRIVRPENVSKINDISEIDMDNIPDSKFDYVIVNDGPLTKLEKEVEILISKLG